MARVSSLFGRRLIAFSGVTGVFVAIVVVVASVAVVTYGPETREPDPFPLAENAGVAMQNSAAIGAVTVGIRSITPTSVELVGGPIGPTTAEWFEFDTAPSLGIFGGCEEWIRHRSQPETKYEILLPLRGAA